jgi:pilus assembly protein FimV
VADVGVIDFDLEVSTPAPAVAPAPAPAPAPAMDEMEALDFTVGGDSPSSAPVATDDGTQTIVNPDALRAAMADDMGMTLDFSASPGSVSPAPAVDMSSINLDLSAGAPGETEFAGDAGAGGDEAGTKLALAKAYVEMGAPEQARELLEEIVAEGETGQVEQAKQLLARLSG